MIYRENIPLVSIIIPVYKVEKYIRGCLQSVLNQTYSNIEVICVDDASPDKSGDICEEYMKSDKRVVVIHKDNNEGLSEARNTGLKRAQGLYICFVDSDDWIGENFVERLLELMRLTGADLVQCNYAQTWCEGIGLRKDALGEKICELSSQEALKNLFAVPFVQPDISYTVVWNKIYKKEILDNLFFEKGKVFEDQFFTYKCFDKAKKIVVTSEKLYFYRENPSSITKQKYNICFQDEIEAHMEQIFYFKEKNKVQSNYAVARIIPLCINHYGRAKFATDYAAMKNAYNLFKKNIMMYLKNDLVSKKYKLFALVFLVSPELYFFKEMNNIYKVV